MRFSLSVALLLVSPALLAAPIITSISPTEGPVKGGTVVTIKGTGFSTTCPPASGCTTPPIAVFFGGAQSPSTQLVDSGTVTATTPAHLPGTVDVVLRQPDGNAFAPAAYSFTGDVTDGFDRILLPIWLPEIRGAYGSDFVTNFSIWNSSPVDVEVEGLVYWCNFDPCLNPFSVILPSRGSTDESGFFPTGTASAPGAFIYVPIGSGGLLYSTLRVQDVSRQAQTWGTSIPVVHDAGFRSSIVALLDIPNDDRFRNMLRIYGDGPGTVLVRIVQTSPPAGTVAEFMLPLNSGATIFNPSYAAFSAFPPPPITTGPAATKLRVEIEPFTYLLRIWAFVSVTNNETQHITVILQQ